MNAVAATPLPDIAIIGGGPAGLMAAETARASGIEVDVFDAMGSVGRKFLIAGKGGLNLTHSEPRPGFDARYRADGQRFDFDFNPHWSAHGHAVAAEAVFDALRARGWLPGARSVEE